MVPRGVTYNVACGERTTTAYPVIRREQRSPSSGSLLKYAEFLRLGGDPYSKRARRLRRRAFPSGPSILLAAMHGELVDPRWRREPAPPTSRDERHRAFLAEESERRAEKLASRIAGVGMR